MDFKLKHTYNFNTLAPAILGEKFSMMKVKAIVTADEAVKYSDIYTTFTTLKTEISNLPDNITDLTFILFTNEDGDKSVYALEYINQDTVVEVEGVNIRVEVRGVTSDDLITIKTKLIELGYTSIDITTFE